MESYLMPFVNTNSRNVKEMRVLNQMGKGKTQTTLQNPIPSRLLVRDETISIALLVGQAGCSEPTMVVWCIAPIRGSLS